MYRRAMRCSPISFANLAEGSFSDSNAFHFLLTFSQTEPLRPTLPPSIPLNFFLS